MVARSTTWFALVLMVSTMAACTAPQSEEEGSSEDAITQRDAGDSGRADAGDEADGGDAVADGGRSDGGKSDGGKSDGGADAAHSAQPSDDEAPAMAAASLDPAMAEGALENIAADRGALENAGADDVVVDLQRVDGEPAQ